MHLTPSEPPEILFYATDADSSDKVYRHGLKAKINAFVAMYETMEDARRATGIKFPSCFAIIARVMAEDGYKFFLSESGEWLTKGVPPKYIRLQ